MGRVIESCLTLQRELSQPQVKNTDTIYVNLPFSFLLFTKLKLKLKETNPQRLPEKDLRGNPIDCLQKNGKHVFKSLESFHTSY